MSAARYPALWRSAMFSSVTEEASHLPLEPALAMVGVGDGGGEKDKDFAGAEILGDLKVEEM